MGRRESLGPEQLFDPTLSAEWTPALDALARLAQADDRPSARAAYADALSALTQRNTELELLGDDQDYTRRFCEAACFAEALSCVHRQKAKPLRWASQRRCRPVASRHDRLGTPVHGHHHQCR